MYNLSDIKRFLSSNVFDEGLISEHSPIAYYFKFFEHITYKHADIIGIESQKILSGLFINIK